MTTPNLDSVTLLMAQRIAANKAEAAAIKGDVEKVKTSQAEADKRTAEALEKAKTVEGKIATTEQSVEQVKLQAEAAKQQSAEAKEQVEAAKQSADAAKQEVAQHKAAAEEAKTKAEQAQTKAQEALDAAKEAKSSIVTPTVDITVGQEGDIKVNNKDTGVKVVTPETVGNEVGKALGSQDASTKILKKQIEATASEQTLKPQLKVALESSIFYIEDALTEELRNKVMSRYYEPLDKKEEGQRDAKEIVRLIQAWYDKLPSHSYISSRGGVFPFTKNKGYRPEYYGADNRSIKRNGNDPQTMVVHGQQPCISFYKSIGNKFDFKLAKFIIEEMGQDAFHLCGDSVDNEIIHGGTITSRAYMEFGYKKGADRDKMLFPPIDGWTKEAPHIGTGCGDKGTAEAGFNTTTQRHDIAGYMNNGYEAQDIQQPDDFDEAKIMELLRAGSSLRFRSAGGYFNAQGKSEFPQADGTTSPKWGTWRGGQHGSRAYGWRLFGTRNTVVRYFDVRGLTGGAINCGLYGTPMGEAVDARDSEAAFKAGIVAVNTKITGGYFTHNYTCGVECIRASGFELTGIYAPDSVVGHPDAHLEHTRGIGGGTSLDPGYQQCTSRYLPMDNIFIHGNVFGRGMRKVMDIHTGNNVRIINNKGEAQYYGVSTVIEELFAGKLIDNKDRNSKDIADPHSFYYQDSNIEVRGNTILSGQFGLHPINGAKGVKFRRDGKKWWLRCHQVWADNVVYAPRGIQCNFGHNHFLIENNQFTFALPFGEFWGMRSISGLTITNQGSGYTTPPNVIIEGGGPEAFGAKASAKIKDGKVIELKLDRMGSRYSEVPTIRIEGGGGEGATATASINTATYGMLVGAEPQYGEMLGCVIAKNWVQNSPEGNFARQIVIGRLRGSSFISNYTDVTPFSSVEKGKLPFGDPYISVSMKYRDGLQSMGFYGGSLDSCEVFGNYEYNQLTQSLHAWTGKNANSDSHKNYIPTSYQAAANVAEIAKLAAKISELEKKLAAAPASPAPTQPPAAPAPATSENQPAATPAQPAGTETTQNPPASGEATQNQPAAPVAPAPAVESPQPAEVTPGEATVLDFSELAATAETAESGHIKLKSINSSPRGGEPENWAGPVKELDGHKAMITSHSDGKGFRFLETEGFTAKAGEDRAIVLPFRQSRGGSTGSAFSLSVLKDTSVLAPALISTNEEAGFKLRHYAGVKINGKDIDPNKLYEYDKWYVVTIVIKAGVDFNKVRFGANQHANSVRFVAVGSGIEFIEGNTSKADEKATALMTQYGVAQ